MKHTFLLLSIVMTSLSFGQTKLPQTFFGDMIGSTASVNRYRATRFLSIYNSDNLSPYYSPQSLFLSGVEHRNIPFNFASPDMLPVDIFNGDISANNKGLVLQGKAINDSLLFQVRTFMGSITGDPIIHSFTRPAEETVNKNKIVPSIAFALSKGRNDLKYRLTGGYVGYFSTGSVNDATIRNANLYYYGRQNKQFWLTGELEYEYQSGRKLSLFSGLKSYYGWELAPFLSSWAHLEMYVSQTGLKAENLFDDFSLSLNYIANKGIIHKSKGIAFSDFSNDQLCVMPEYFISSKKDSEIKIYGKFGGLRTTNNSAENRYFQKEIVKNNWAFGAMFMIVWDDNISLTTDLNYEQWIKGNGVSGSVKAEKLSSNHSLGIELQSKLRFPNITELYGNFKRENVINNKQFGISGSDELIPARENRLELNYKVSKGSNKISATGFYTSLNDPILMKTNEFEKSDALEDYYRSAKYGNGNRYDSFGGIISGDFSLTDNIEGEIAYKFVENSEVKYIPKNKAHLGITIELPFGSDLYLGYEYIGAKEWKEYRLSNNPTDNSWKLKEANLFDLGITQRLKYFYLFKNIDFRLSMENIFDEKVKYHPLGNIIGRAVILSLKAEL